MIHTNLIQLWGYVMKHKNTENTKNTVKDTFKIELIAVKQDQDSAKRTKESAQRLLAMMFASLHKKGRPAKEKQQVLKYVV